MTSILKNEENWIPYLLVHHLPVEGFQLITLLQQLRCRCDPLRRNPSWDTNVADFLCCNVLLLHLFKIHQTGHSTWVDGCVSAAGLFLEVLKVCLVHMFVCFRWKGFPTIIYFILPCCTTAQSGNAFLRLQLCFQLSILLWDALQLQCQHGALTLGRFTLFLLSRKHLPQLFVDLLKQCSSALQYLGILSRLSWSNWWQRSR